MRGARFLIFIAAAALAAGSLQAKDDPVLWKLSAAPGYDRVAPGGKTWLELKATIQPGWHLYSPTTPPGGPIVSTIQLEANPQIAEAAVYRSPPVRKLDSGFQMDTETYSNSATFLIEATTKPGGSGPLALTAMVRYQTCNDVKCLPPVKKTAATSVLFDPTAPEPAFTPPPGYVAVPGAAIAAVAAASAPEASAPASPAPAPANTPLNTSQDLLPFLLTAFAFGLAALFTPCVFPMIPITVSFFLNQSAGEEQKRSAPWAQATVFCVGIVVLFTGLGFLVTALTGPFGVVQLGSSPWVNGFISLVFLVFGLSLLGAFELRLPSGLLTRLDRASQGGGYAATLLMGLTFSLTSFACIGPIVGPLLVASVQSKGLQPVLGMASFATGLALPFFFLALFPSYLKKLPRSGGWMARVKVVLGFVVLGAMLKYLSNIDQVLQTHWLTRERFLAGWMVLAALAGLYLLGFLRLEGTSKDEPLGGTRTLVAAAFLIFAISLAPGLFGARLGELDAYVPEPAGGVYAGMGGASVAAAPGNYFKNDLDGALAAARAQNKLVLVNFTGYACTNCHWMKANIFPLPQVQAVLKDFILVDLYTDGTDAASDKNQKFEDRKFNTVSIPFYAIVDANQNVIATFPQLTRDPKEFVSFLESKPAPKT